MTKLSLIAALPLLALTACGGASGPQSVGSNAPPASGGAPGTGGTGGGVTAPAPAPSPTPTAAPTSSPSPAPTPSPTPTPGTGGTGTGVVGGGTPSPTPTPTHFMTLSAAKSWQAIGAFQGYETSAASTGILYRANAATVGSPTGTITYNPRDGVFTLNLTDQVAGVTATNTRFQDPAHRTDFANFRTPEWGVPDLAGFNYMEAGSTETVTGENGQTSTTTDALTFFYQRPGSATYYVSLAGYVRSLVDAQGFGSFQRGAMVFGDQTPRAQVPASGGGTYTGGFLATMVSNPTLDDRNARTNYFQWIAGDSSITIDFSRAAMSLVLTGTAMAANYNGANIPDAMLSVKNGATFVASGSGVIDLLRSGGFSGAFQNARFVNPDGSVRTIDFSGITPGSSAAGASSIDGTFFGPNAVNVGGNFRVVGGLPDQRVDVTGAFTGARQ